MSAQKTQVAKATVFINSTSAKVWEALVNPELIKQYLFGTSVETDWRVGSAITYSGQWQGKPYQDKGLVMRVEPRKLLITTFWSSLSGLPDLPENYKTVRYDLTEENHGILLTLTQDNNASAEEANHSSETWKLVLNGIKALLEGDNIS